MRRALLILITSSIFFNISAGFLGPIYAIFVQNIGGNAIDAGTAWAIYAITVGVLYIIFGRLEDKLDKKKVFVLGRFFDFIGVVSYLFVRTPFQLFLVQGFLGIGAAMKDPAFNALYSRLLMRGKETSEWSYQLGLTSVMWGVAALLGGIIITYFSFRTLFILMSMATGTSFLVSTLILKKSIWSEILKGFNKKIKL